MLWTCVWIDWTVGWSLACTDCIAAVACDFSWSTCNVNMAQTTRCKESRSTTEAVPVSECAINSNRLKRKAT